MPRYQLELKVSVDGYVEVDAPDEAAARKAVEGVDSSMELEADVTIDSCVEVDEEEEDEGEDDA